MVEVVVVEVVVVEGEVVEEMVGEVESIMVVVVGEIVQTVG